MASNLHQQFMVPKYKHLSMDSSGSASRSVDSTISLRKLKAHDRKLRIVEDMA